MKGGRKRTCSAKLEAYDYQYQHFHRLMTDGALEALLGIWARWDASALDGGLGYARITPAGRMARDGGVMPRPERRSRQHTPSNPTAEMVEGASIQLYQPPPQLAECVRCYYLHPACTLAKGARVPGIPPGAFRRSLELGKAWLAGRL